MRRLSRFLRILKWSCGTACLIACSLGLWGYIRVSSSWEGHFTAEGRVPPVQVTSDGAVTLTARDGTAVRGRLRVPGKAKPPYAGVVIVGGVRTGWRGADMIPVDCIEQGIVVLSLDYRLGDMNRPGKNARWHEWLRYGPAFISSVEDAIDAGEWLAARSDVDPKNVVMVGVSFGSFIAPAAFSAQKRYRSLAIVYGGAPIDAMAYHNFHKVPGPLRWLASRFVGAVAAPLEPTKHLARNRERPVLFLASVHDKRVPADCVEALSASIAGPKELRMLETVHVSPSEKELIARLSRDVLVWVDESKPSP